MTVEGIVCDTPDGQQLRVREVSRCPCAACRTQPWHPSILWGMSLKLGSQCGLLRPLAWPTVLGRAALAVRPVVHCVSDLLHGPQWLRIPSAPEMPRALAVR
jgi:hypothetical protein